MILFDLGKKIEDLNQQLNVLLEHYSSNPLFWSILFLVLVAIAYWSIQYFNKK